MSGLYLFKATEGRLFLVMGNVSHYDRSLSLISTVLSLL